jgi:hypothetical protein
MSDRVFGKPLTINDYRHIFEIAIQKDPNYKDMTIAEKEKLHESLLHNHNTALRYNLIWR